MFFLFQPDFIYRPIIRYLYIILSKFLYTFVYFIVRFLDQIFHELCLYCAFNVKTFFTRFVWTVWMYLHNLTKMYWSSPLPRQHPVSALLNPVPAEKLPLIWMIMLTDSLLDDSVFCSFYGNLLFLYGYFELFSLSDWTCLCKLSSMQDALHPYLRCLLWAQHNAFLCKPSTRKSVVNLNVLCYVFPTDLDILILFSFKSQVQQ